MESPLNFQLVFESAPGLYLVLKPDFTIVAVTDAFLKATMTRRENVLGKDMFEVFPDNPADPHASGVQNIKTSFQRVINSRATDILAVQKYDIRRPEDQGGEFEERYWSPTNSPVFGPDGEISHIIYRVQDVTELVHSQQVQSSPEELLKRAQELELIVAERTVQLNESVAELESFCYSLSHDMRAPLRAIHSFTEIILTDCVAVLDDQHRQYLKKVIQNASRLDRLIQDVLAYTRLSKQEIKQELVDVDQLVRQIIEERPELRAPHATVVIEGTLLSMLGHEASLTQCITNLLDNAVKFVHRGVHPTVRVSTEKIENDIRLTVEDNGIGIDANGQRRLFQMFHRIHSGDEYKGTGLGLAIVRKSAERMNGQVTVESTVGRGSRFWVQLPSGVS